MENASADDSATVAGADTSGNHGADAGEENVDNKNDVRSALSVA